MTVFNEEKKRSKKKLNSLPRFGPLSKGVEAVLKSLSSFTGLTLKIIHIRDQFQKQIL